MLRKIIFQIVLAITIISCAACAPLRVDGPYNGQIIDSDTKQPIEGVVINASWSRVYPNVAGSSSKYYDTRETLTDKNGEFEIPGMGLLIFSFIDKADITIFKAGYDGWGPGGWVSLDINHLYQWQGKVTRDDGKLVIRLKKLSLEERRHRPGLFPSTSPDAPNKKRRLYIIERNKEMIEIGRPESTLLPVE